MEGLQHPSIPHGQLPYHPGHHLSTKHGLADLVRATDYSVCTIQYMYRTLYVPYTICTVSSQFQHIPAYVCGVQLVLEWDLQPTYNPLTTDLQPT